MSDYYFYHVQRVGNVVVAMQKMKLLMDMHKGQENEDNPPEGATGGPP